MLISDGTVSFGFWPRRRLLLGRFGRIWGLSPIEPDILGAKDVVGSISIDKYEQKALLYQIYALDGMQGKSIFGSSDRRIHFSA